MPGTVFQQKTVAEKGEAVLVYEQMVCGLYPKGLGKKGLPAVDRNFVANAAQSNLSEIELGRLALQKATDTQVKEFAQMMVDMHTTAQNELKALGSNRNLTVADQLDEEHQSIRDQLSALSGVAFDKAYINGQVTAHQKTSAIMQTEIDNGQDGDVKAYATKSKPVVDQHLALAAFIKTSKGL